MNISKIELTGAISRWYSDCIEVDAGESLTVHYNNERFEVAGPAVMVADVKDINHRTNSIWVTKVRQVLNGEHQVSPEAEIINEGIRKFLRGIAVHGEYRNAPGHMDIPIYDGELHPDYGMARLQVPGGFVPMVRPGHVAVEAACPTLPPSRTSWVILKETDPRVKC